MKKLVGAAILVVLAAMTLHAQPALRVYTMPKVPPRDVLDRLNLAVNWKTKLPTGGLRDGLFTLQLLPAGKNRVQLLVQTIFGAVFLLDAETGDLLWRTTVGIPNWNGQPAGYNDQNLFISRRDILYVLNRKNGVQRYYTIDKDTKLPNYGFTLRAPLSAAPQADDDMIFFCLGDRIEAYVMPDWDAAEGSLKASGGAELSAAERKSLLDRTSALPPLLKWNYHEPGMNVEQPVLLAGGQLTAATVGGAILSLNKFEKSQPYEFQTNSTITARMNQHGLMAYIGADDSIVYAINMGSQRLMWRFLASAPIRFQPGVTDRDVFVSADRKGLYRVDRDTGRAAWVNPQADRFLSTNQRFVYALDRTGLFMILDYARGTTLAHYDLRDWTLPVPNDLTDRCYLANHDGQILCLRHRTDVAPLRNKTIETKLLPKKDDKKDEPKDADKEKDKDKEKEKDKDAGFLDDGSQRAVLCFSWPRLEARPPQYRAVAWDRRWLRP